MSVEFFRFVLFYPFLAGFLFLFISGFWLIWACRKSGDERFVEIASLDYIGANTPGYAVRAIKAYRSAYKAAPRSAVGVVSIINVFLWFIMFTSMLIIIVMEIIFMII